jgi:hypothetical protein
MEPLRVQLARLELLERSVLPLALLRPQELLAVLLGPLLCPLERLLRLLLEQVLVLCL